MGYADELFDLTGRVVLVTGGSRGLGREMALAAARCGADVVIASRKYDACAATAEEIERATGRAALPYGVHIGRWDQLPGLVDAVYERFGRLDALINNAGMSPVYDSLDSVTEKMFDAVLNLNLKGPFRLSVLAGERMKAAGRGAIVNVSSTGSIRPRAAIVPYAAAKAGLNALTEGLAQGLGPQVRVNTLMAGPFATQATRHWEDDKNKLDEGVRPHALQRIGKPSEVVGAALYLISDASSYTSSATLRVDGGMP
ncbi:NAD(P)-dependent dehydrogenase, short-chain alcohol dehydrogenase family [Thermomonospora echinospora]|uniref:NAD(P)-dependent dehydrogenase, short-chain alcohol dehydrogenase family n=1 Tax=Thermomonospora echinospora TaxID=1992 RepID=A0A1H6BG49_9ACTN|nr:glucose 1-dehydrogenase [Thermomonospora echinospora]SEG59305.1 NAD(P)-dependent dehydrogenase, short-chain alcohol dehydrogenase family [Thermomonospora echinospora]